MAYRIGIVCLWVLLLLLIVLGIWGLVLYHGLALWYVPLIVVSVVILILAARWCVRGGYTLRQRRRLYGERLPRPDTQQTSNLNRDWALGLRMLRRSRLGRLGSPLYALPWLLLLSEDSKAKHNLLSHSGLNVALRPLVELAGALEWWFLDSGVVLDPAARLVEGRRADSMEWKRLLYWLSRSRQREPLNGVVVAISCEHLLDNSDERLAERGLNLRERLDDLVKVYGVRVPVYFVITGTEVLPGFTRWSADLTPAQREQPFGLLSQGSGHTVMAFLDEMFEGIGRRLSELRLEQGLSKLPDEQAFGVPERVAGLRPRVENYLLSALAPNPYCESPLLGGLFLTAQTSGHEAQPESQFSHQLLGQLLPAQRYAFQSVTRWHRWRRWLTHLAVVAWLVVCSGTGALLIFAERHTHQVLADALDQQLLIAQGTGLGAKLEALRRFGETTRQRSHEQLSGWKRLLPYSHYVQALETKHRATFVKYFNDEIRQPVFDDLISDNLKNALASGDPQLVAAFAEFYVRRINLLDARLGKRPLATLEQRPQLGLLYQVYGPGGGLSAAQMVSLTDSYANYLAWQPDVDALRNQRADLLAQLASMGLEMQPHGWLTAWAEQQGDLPPMRLSEYWPDDANPPVMLSGAYTVQGRGAILGFIEEIGRASRDQQVWTAQRERFLSDYLEDTQQAWHTFIQQFLLSAQTRLKNQDDWRQVLAVAGTTDDPFLKLLHRSAERFELIPAERRADWVARVVLLDRLLKLAAEDDLLNASTVLNNLKITHAVGGDVLKGVVNGGTVSRGVGEVRTELAQARSLAKFQQLMRGVITSLQKGDAQAFQVALDTWGYASNPAVKAAPLWQAQDLRDTLATTATGVNAHDDVAWALATGSLDFSVRYAGQIAACQLQRDWNGQLLSVIDGVQDPVILNTLLYGERGQLPAFMNGPVSTFVQRDAARYGPAHALGVKVPLTDAFYAYASRMQHAQTHIDSAQRQNQVIQATRHQDKQVLESEQKTLQAQQQELQQGMALLQATSAAVELSTTASQVNLGARQLPQQTRLRLQCSAGATVLDNYNFPTSANFLWAPKACSDVSLEILFANFKLTRHWTGERAFVDFLRTFQGGQHTFTPDDFPGQRDLMGSENLTSIQLTYRQQGEKALLDSYAQADALQGQMSTLNQRLKAINEQLASMDNQAAAQDVRLATLGAPVQRDLASIRPPSQIARCWTPEPAAPSASLRNSGIVDVGIYHSEVHIRRLEAQLHIMGYETRREVLPSPAGQRLQKLRVVGLTDPAAASVAIDRLVRKLDMPQREGPFG